MIARADATRRLRHALDRAPVVVLTGPRQVGKSTLASQVVDPAPSHRFDLEDPRDLARLASPALALGALDATVVIDEAQRRPELFPILRVLVDEDRRPGRFLVLGSASPDLIGLAAESLAGRVALVELGGFGLDDVGADALQQLWLRGGLPPSYLARSERESVAWREDYIRTFLERDLGNLGFRLPATAMRRFWTMVAHYHGQTWNGAELARSMGVSQSTVRRYLDALTDALVVRQLPPWHANVSKRQVRSPKVFLRDTGLLHRLLGIGDATELASHPKLGASFEGFVIESLVNLLAPTEAWFWATHAGAELDLLMVIDAKRVGVEVKYTDAPSVTPSMRAAMEDLDLDRLVVVHGGDKKFPMAPGIEAIGVSEALTAGIGTTL